MKVSFTFEEAKSAIRAAAVEKLNNQVDVAPNAEVSFVCNSGGHHYELALADCDVVEVEIG